MFCLVCVWLLLSSKSSLLLSYRQITWSLERQFDEADVALYNVRTDPAEKVDLKAKLPEVFKALRYWSQLFWRVWRIFLHECYPPKWPSIGKWPFSKSQLTFSYSFDSLDQCCKLESLHFSITD
jgi:hypothetical protein